MRKSHYEKRKGHEQKTKDLERARHWVRNSLMKWHPVAPCYALLWQSEQVDTPFNALVELRAARVPPDRILMVFNAMVKAQVQAQQALYPQIKKIRDSHDELKTEVSRVNAENRRLDEALTWSRRTMGPMLRVFRDHGKSLDDVINFLESK